MRQLLQRIADGRYYQRPGTWTANADHARSFADAHEAAACCRRERLPPARLVLKFEDSAFDLRLPCITVTYPKTKSNSFASPPRARAE
jgi:hypothetical protein